MASPELEALLSEIRSSSGQVQDEDDPLVWERNTNYTPDPNRGMYEPMKTQATQYNKTPLSRATLKFYELDRNELKRFQELAFQAGYYGSTAERGDVPFGAYDEETFKVWATLAKRAANVAKAGKQHTIWDVLQDDVLNRPASLGKAQKAKRQPLVTQLPNPTDVKDLVLSVSQDVLGREVDEEFINDFTAMYTKMVSEFQKNKYSLEGSEEGGTITAPPSPESLARFRLRYERPEQYEEKAGAKRHNAYVQLLKGAL